MPTWEWPYSENSLESSGSPIWGTMHEHSFVYKDIFESTSPDWHCDHGEFERKRCCNIVENSIHCSGSPHRTYLSSFVSPRTQSVEGFTLLVSSLSLPFDIHVGSNAYDTYNRYQETDFVEKNSYLCSGSSRLRPRSSIRCLRKKTENEFGCCKCPGCQGFQRQYFCARNAEGCTSNRYICYGINERGCTRYKQRNSTRSPTQWGEDCGYQLQLCNALRIFLSVQWWVASLVCVARIIVAIVSRLSFLDYDKPTPLTAADFGWQILRITILGVVTLWIALHTKNERNKRLVRVGSIRYQRPQKRMNGLRLSVIGLCLLVANAHVIDVHQSICLKSPNFEEAANPMSFGFDDIFDDVAKNDWSTHTSARCPSEEASGSKKGLVPGSGDQGGTSQKQLLANTLWELYRHDDLRYESFGLKERSHVSDRWCIASPGDYSCTIGELQPASDSLWIAEQWKRPTRGSEDRKASVDPYPPISLWRPNPQLQQHADAVVPDIRRGPNGFEIVGTILPPPNWESTAMFRAAAASGAIRRGSDGHLVVHIRSWYIAHNGLCIHQPRDFAMRPQLLVRLLHALRRTWRDHLPGHETITARAVRPPPVEADATRRFHIIAEINKPARTDLNPILVAIREITREGVSVPVWCTALLPTQMGSVDLYQACWPSCRLHQFLIPVGGNLRRWLTPYHSRVITPGLFIPCWYDRRLQQVQQPIYETEDDNTELMQRSINRDPTSPQQTPSSTASSSGTVLVHGFRMSAEHRLIVLDPGSQSTYFQQLNEAWRAPRHDQLIDYHLVASPPRDLTNTGDSVFILEWTTDRNRQAAQSDQLILLDVTLHEAGQSTAPHSIRRIVWTRHMMTRQGILHLTSSSAICDRHDTDCRVQINHRLWAQDDLMTRPITHGDYVDLQIRGGHLTSPVELRVELCEQESADSQRYIFQPSPQRSPTTSSIEDDESESTKGTERNSRSRSPYGHEDRHPEGSSFLQLSANKRTTDLQPTLGCDLNIGTSSWTTWIWRHSTSTTKQLTLSIPTCDVLHGWQVCSRVELTSQACEHPSFNVGIDALRGCRHDQVRRPYCFHHTLFGGSCSELHSEWNVVASFYGNISGANTDNDGRLLWVDPFIGLPPPGNGKWTIVDLRSGRLDVLEDFNISSTVITLHDFLPSTVVASLPIQFTGDKALALISKWPENVILPLDVTWPDLPAICSAFIDATIPFDIDTLQGIGIFVDGSSSICVEDGISRSAAYSVVIVGEHPTSLSLFGFLGGDVITDPCWSSYLGAQSQSALDAERSGVATAVLWALQWDYSGSFPVTIYFDNVAAGYGANGQWRIDSESTLSTLTRDITQAAEELYGSLLSFAHVKGHSSHPCNELADYIAKKIVTGEIQPLANTLDFRPIVQAILTDGPFCWLGVAAALGKPDLPDIEKSFECRRAELSAVTTEVHTFAPISVTATEVFNCTLQLATINVRSLFDDPDASERSKRFTEKGKYLAEQLAWYSYQVIGIQESCVRHSGITRIGPFLRCNSGCNERGQLGCELWIDCCVGQIQITERNLVQIHSDPRRLIVRLQAKGLDVIFAVLHALHSGYSDDDVSKWWDYTINLCKGFQSLAPCCVLMDSNAQTAQPHPPIVGSILDGVHSHTTDGLIRFCDECGLWLPSTFTDMHTGDNGTWRHPSGLWRRIDYIALPSGWRQSAVQSWVDHEIDLNQQTTDHLAVGCKVWLTWAKTRSGAKAKLDFRPLSDPQVRTVMHEKIMALPPIPWMQDVHSHAHRIKTALHEVFEEILPRATRRPRTSYITDGTWQCRTAKLEALKQLKRLRCTLSECWRFWAFSSWQRDQPLRLWYRPHLKWLLHWECQAVRIHRNYIFLTGHLKSSLRRDRVAYIDQCAAQCEHKPLHHVFESLKKLGIGGKVSKMSQRMLPQFYTAQGTPARTTTDVAEAWRRHCATLEAGESVSREQLLHWAHGMNVHRTCQHLLPLHIPSRVDLEHHLRRMQCRKSVGCDNIPSDVCHFLPSSLGRLLYPLLLKEVLLQEEPLEHKGGRLAYAYKGRGAVSDPSSFRGLMVTSVLGKAIRSALREKMLPDYRTYAGSDYFSARQYGHVGQAAMSLRLFAKCAKDSGSSLGMIFLDIRSAYYRIVRELALGFSGSDSQICRVLAYFQMPTTAIEELRAFIRESGGAMEDAECLPFHRQMMVELSNASWFVVADSDQVTQTHGGTRPGDGLADVLFGFVFSRLLRMLQEELISQHLWDERTWDDESARENPFEHSIQHQALPSNLRVVWADDLALAIRDPDVGSCVARTQAVLDHLFTWCKRFGLEPNTAKGKSEVLLQLRGAASRSWKAHLFDCQHPTLSVRMADGSRYEIRLVASYKHLGGLHYIRGKLLKDIKVRCGMMTSAFGKYSKKVFLNRHIGLLQKSQLLESLIFSILRWNLGAWHQLDAQSAHRYHASTLTLARRVCIGVYGTDEVWTWTDEQVLARMRMTSPEESLHLARLSFFTTAFHTAPTGLWMLIVAEKSWLSEISTALVWAHQQLRCSTPLYDYHDFHDAWFAGVQVRGRHWKGWLRRAKRHAILQRTLRIGVREWHVDFLKKLSSYGFRTPTVFPQIKPDMPHPEFICGPCRQVFRTKAAWATHCRKKHQRIDPLRRFITDPRCKACGGYYHTTRRLLAHLNYDATCARAHAVLSEAGDPLPGRGARDEDKGPELPLPIRRPVRKFQFVADDDGDETILQDVTFTNLLRTRIWQVTTVAEGMECIKQCVLTTVVSIADAWDSMAIISQEQGLPEVAGLAIYEASKNWSSGWFFEDCQDAVVWPKSYFVSVNNDNIVAERLLETADGVEAPSTFPAPPPCLRELFVINFFSGVRREGDIQHWTMMASPPSGYTVTAISVDIIFDSRNGDLTRVEIQQLWVNFISRATVVGAYLAPPCNTWSISRWRALSDGEGPRPVRSASQPFGLPSMTLREVEHVLLGNCLLFFAMDILVLQCFLQRIAVIEHPVPHDPLFYPSIWHTTAMKAIRTIPSFQEVDVFQGYYGAVSPKPTRLGITGHQHPKVFLDLYRTQSVLPPPLKMGRSRGASEYSTAQLKEYPAGFSLGLAHLSVSWWQLHCLQEPQGTAEPNLCDFVKPFAVDCIGVHSRGEDTRGHIGV